GSSDEGTPGPRGRGRARSAVGSQGRPVGRKGGPDHAAVSGDERPGRSAGGRPAGTAGGGGPGAGRGARGAEALGRTGRRGARRPVDEGGRIRGRPAEGAAGSVRQLTDIVACPVTLRLARRIPLSGLV